MTSNQRDILAANLASVEGRMASACAGASRSRESVTLIAVTKTISVDIAALLPGLGVNDLGESRPQELWRKAELSESTVRWHLIGHLQRNKIERTLRVVHRIHSIDSERLLTTLDAINPGRIVDVLLEFNCGGEASKLGFNPQQADSLVPVMLSLKHVRVVGLMTMAPFEGDPERCRPVFAHLRQLREQLRRQVGERHPLNELSMGMSNDFEVAIQEGATMVRLGTILFKGLQT
jgi:PLP dependent protein